MKIGIIGAGKWGENHIRTFSELGYNPYICDINLNRLSELQLKYKCSLANVDYKEMLKYVDAVSIITSSNTHYEVAKECLLAGKHVLIEKPMTLEEETSSELVEIAEDMGLTLAVGHLYRFNSAVNNLRYNLNKVGRIHYITSQYVHATNFIRTDSGVISNIAIHSFDMLDYILQKEPISINCKTINHYSPTFEDCALITLNYDDFIVSLEVSWLHPQKIRNMWIVGENQTVYSDFLTQNSKIYNLETLGNKINIKDSVDAIFNKSDPLKEEIKHFISCIENNTIPINDGEVGLKMVKLCDKALESARNNEEIYL